MGFFEILWDSMVTYGIQESAESRNSMYYSNSAELYNIRKKYIRSANKIGCKKTLIKNCKRIFGYSNSNSESTQYTMQNFDLSTT